jgi:hypothetical protein
VSLTSLDYEHIRALSYRYTFHLDAGDMAAVGELLANAVLRPAMPGVRDEAIRGRQAITEFYMGQVVTDDRGDPRTRHLITNQLIEPGPEPDTATSQCYFTVLQRPPKEPFQLVVGGRYHDRFAKVDGAWRFAEKEIQVDHLNAIEHHFVIAPERRSSR